MAELKQSGAARAGIGRVAAVGWERWIIGPGPAAGVVWAIVVLLTVACSVHMPAGLLGDPMLPTWVRLTLLATEAAYTGVAVLLGWAGLAGVRHLEQKIRRPSMRMGLGFVRSLAVVTVLFLWISAWILFWSVGRFVDVGGLRFMAVNISVLLQYVREIDPWLLMIVPAVALIAGVGGLKGLPLLGRRWPRTWKSAVSYSAAALFGASVILASAGEAAQRQSGASVEDPVTGIPFPLRKVFQVRRSQRTGPMAALIHSTFPTSEGRNGGDYASAAGMRVERPALEPPGQYLARVDETSRKPWNVVIVIMESVRADCMALGGASPSLMPALDALARESKVFLDCTSTSTNTLFAALCPLTGQYSLHSHEHWEVGMPPSCPRVLIHDILKGVGYRTGVFSSQNEHWGHMSRTLAGPGTDRFFHAPMAAGNGEKNIREHSSMDDTVGNTLIDDRITVDEAIRWIEAGEDPFCVSLNLQSPHFPYVLPGGEGRKRERPRIPFFTIPKDRLEEVRGRYGACVAYLDAQLGRLLNFLRLRGEWDRTVIVVTADHGEAWHEHGFTAHAYRLYDEVLRVPLVVRAPLLPPGVDRRPAQLIDIPPTVLQLLGLPDHRGFQGCNLLAPDFPYDRTRFLVSLTPLVNQYGVVRNGFKMIRDRDYGIEILYHLRTDPGEREDVMDRYPVVVQDLRCRLDSWILEQLDYYGRKERHLREYPPRFIP